MKYLVPCRHLDTMEYKSVIVEAQNENEAITLAMLTHENIALVGKVTRVEWSDVVQ